MADVPVGDLIARLRLQAADFQKGLTGATRTAEQYARRIESAFRPVSRLLGGLGAAFSARAIVSATLDAERATARLTSALASSGRAGRIAVGEMQALADSLQKITTFDDEAILDVISTLSKFRGIADKDLPALTRAVLDFATATETDAVSAAQKFGVAMNNPVRGLRALQQAGVEVTPALQAMIKQLVETGQVVKARSILMEEFASKTRGAAEAARNTLGGSLKALGNAFENLLEQDSLVGVRTEVEQLTERLESPAFRQAADQIGGELARGIETVADVALTASGHLELMRAALGAIIGYSVAGPWGALAGGILGVSTAATETQRALEAARAATEALAGASGVGLEAARKQAEASLAVLEAKAAALRASIPADPTGLAAFGGIDPQTQLARQRLEEVEQAAAELRVTLDYLPPSVQKASDALSGGEAGGGGLSGSALKAAEALAKKQQAVRDSVEELQHQAAVLQGAADAAAVGEDALKAYNHEVEIMETVSKIAAEAVENGMTGSLDDLVGAALAAAEGIEAAKAQMEGIDEAAKAAERAAEEAKRQAERESERAAEALAQPFLDAGKHIQDYFADTISQIIEGGEKSFTSFGDFLKSLFARLAGELASLMVIRPVFGGIAGSLGIAGAGSGSTLIGAGSNIVGGLFSGASGGGGILGSLLSGGSGLASGIFSGFGSSAFATTIGRALGDFLGGAGAQALGQIGTQGVAQTALGSSLGSIFGTAFSPASIIGGIGGTLLGRALGFQGLGGAGGIALTTGLTGLGAYGGSLAGSAVAGLAGGVLGGAAAGSVVPVIGTIIGALIGALVAAFAGGKSKFPHVDIRTVLDAADLPPLEQGFQHTRTGPFGTLGVSGQGSSGGVKPGLIRSLLGALVGVDTAIASHLTDAEVELVKASEILSQQKATIKGNIGKVLRERITRIFTEIGIPLESVRTFVHAGPVEELTQRAEGFLEERKQFQSMLDELRGIETPELTEAERALKRVKELIAIVADTAPDKFGIAVPESIEELQAKGIAKVREGFVETLQKQILAIRDPISVIADEFRKSAEEMVREAQSVGAGLVETEELIGEKRQALVKQIFAPLDSLLDQIEKGIGILLPSQVAANAEADFRGLASQVSAGEFVDPADLAESARLFLDASRAINASSVAFFEDLELVKATLQASKLNLPGFATGGSFTVGGRGGIDNVVPLFRATRGEVVTVTPSSRGSQSSEAAAEVRALRSDVQTLIAITDRNSHELMRLARRAR